MIGLLARLQAISRAARPLFRDMLIRGGAVVHVYEDDDGILHVDRVPSP